MDGRKSTLINLLLASFLFFSPPLIANDMLDAMDKMFGVSEKSFHYDFERDSNRSESDMTEAVLVPVPSSSFRSYEVYTNARYGNVCGVHAKFSDSTKQGYARLQQTLSNHFGNSGLTAPTQNESMNDVNAIVEKVIWDKGIAPEPVEKVLLTRTEVVVDDSYSAVNALALHFTNFEECMRVDDKFSGDTKGFYKTFHCDVLSHTFYDKHGVTFIDTSPPKGNYKNAKSAALSFVGYRKNMVDTLRFKFQAEVTKQGSTSRYLSMSELLHNSYWYPSSWVANKERTPMRAFPNNGEIVFFDSVIGEAGFFFRKVSDPMSGSLAELSLIKSGQGFTGIARDRDAGWGKEESLTTFTCDISEEAWKEVLDLYFAEAKEYRFDKESGRLRSYSD